MYCKIEYNILVRRLDGFGWPDLVKSVNSSIVQILGTIGHVNSGTNQALERQ